MLRYEERPGVELADSAQTDSAGRFAVGFMHEPMTAELSLRVDAPGYDAVETRFRAYDPRPEPYVVTLRPATGHATRRDSTRR